jgi:DNA-binding response OmpR family regulator
MPDADDAPLVLLVDDDPVIRRLLDINFRMDGWRTQTAARGDDALATAAKSPPDAIVMDLMMPGLDGFGVCERLHDDAVLRQVPIVMLTARAGDEDRERGYALGVVEYVAKPFDPVALVATVRALVEGRS